jgi:hypothetical protein
MSKKKEKTIGEFKISQSVGATNDYIRIRTKSENWGITFRDDTKMYATLCVALKGDDDVLKGIEVRAVLAYYLANMPYDAEFVDDVMQAIARNHQRQLQAIPTPTDKEEDEAVDELTTLAKANEVIKNATV